MTEEVERQYGDPCYYCGHPLWASASIERGYCERCRIELPDDRRPDRDRENA